METTLDTILIGARRSSREIEQLRKVVDRHVNEGTTQYRADTFEGGVQATLQWLFGETDTHPSLEE